MKFRTEIEVGKMPELSHGEGIVMLGSCFTDSIGERLERDGFDVTHNPLGMLYNAASLRRVVALSLGIEHLSIDQLVTTDDGMWHCLDFATKYNSGSAEGVLTAINSDLNTLGDNLKSATTLMITLGTAYVFERLDTGRVVGNCHKLPAALFRRYRLSVEECAGYLRDILAMLPENIKNVIFTVSPIRHTADGLHGNELSKATLLMAVDALMETEGRKIWYFPSYEIMIDDLRDYRFYAADMKHPSDVAVDYIYGCFADACFSAQTMKRAIESHKEWLRGRHVEAPRPPKGRGEV